MKTNGELLTVLDHLERDKGINREILLEAVESALVGAVKRTLGSKGEDVSVKIDRQTGEIKVYSAGEEISSGEFGRIAAQTAKQIIVQKIREAERDVIFSDYQNRIGSVITGTVYRFEKGNIVIDLGKTEGFIPKGEQSQKESFRQADRIKAYVLEVNKTGKGPQIILSRSNPGLIKKLFELEIPEIYEGIVEIKAISREPGDRTKIAVYSKDDKVDCVGACVGMRGSRVKNIVKELQGEKIDIVRWSEDAKEYMISALNPAKVSEIKLDKQVKKAFVTVEDDQLSLAIGKKGQNVRLASKLTGWDIDINPKAVLAAKDASAVMSILGGEAPAKESAEEVKSGGEETGLSSIEGVGPKTRELLEEANLKTVKAIASCSMEDLLSIKGIGEKTAEKILKSAKKILGEDESR
ncbi:MAG: transcription termination factor NusA [Candidatus Omnitrophota bacterium]